MEKKQRLFDVNDFVLCPNGELGTIECFLSDDAAKIKNSLGEKEFNISSLKKLKKIKENEDSVYFRQNLNPDLWNNFSLYEDVREALLLIAKDFIKEIEDGEFSLPVVDIVMVGSEASFNYTDFSDIDIHILSNLELLGNSFFVKKYFEIKRKLFSREHLITVKGHPVELYVEDIKNNGVYNGVFSVLKNKWLKIPSKDIVNIDMSDVQKKFDDYHEMISQIINSSGNLDEAIKLYRHLFKMRKNSLMLGGEFSVENLVFKKIRDNGLLDRLREYMYKERDKALSLESITEMFRKHFS